MRYGSESIVLDRKDEFVVVGQAYNIDSQEDKKPQRMSDLEATSISIDHLVRSKSGGEQEWTMPYDRFDEYRVALHGVSGFYRELSRHEDSGSYCENASREYNRLAELSRTANGLLRGLLVGMGVVVSAENS